MGIKREIMILIHRSLKLKTKEIFRTLVADGDASDSDDKIWGKIFL